MSLGYEQQESSGAIEYGEPGKRSPFLVVELSSGDTHGLNSSYLHEVAFKQSEGKISLIYSTKVVEIVGRGMERLHNALCSHGVQRIRVSTEACEDVQEVWVESIVVEARSK